MYSVFCGFMNLLFLWLLLVVLFDFWCGSIGVAAKFGNFTASRFGGRFCIIFLCFYLF